MKSQRKAREVALQVLFQKNFTDNANAEELFYAFADNFKFEKETKDYAFFLTQNVIQNELKINEQISQLSNNWRIERIALIDKILLQIAIFEMRFSTQTETAPKLLMTDIIDLAKKYSSSDSKNFINGILDQIYNQSLNDQSDTTKS